MTYIENPRGHVVFDCDGTLISSYEAIYEGLAETMTIMLEREVSLDEAREKYAADLLQVCLNFGLDPQDDIELKQKLIKTWESVASKQTQPMRLFPGIKDLILELTKKNYQLYVWTARDRRSTLRILKDLEVAQYFLEFRCLDDCEPKPSPVGLEQMVGDIPKNNIVMIGDSSPDINGAKSFGVASIAACWAGEDLEDYLSNFGPTSLAKRPMDCVKEIEKLIG